MAKHGGCYSGAMPTIGISAAILVCFLIQPSDAWPVITIEDFTVANMGNRTIKDHTIEYDIKIKNANTRSPIEYDTLNVKFFYTSNSQHIPIGNATFSPFRQTFLYKVHRIGKFQPIGVKWDKADAPEEFFRVEIEGSYRYEILLFFRSKHRHINRGIDLKVNYKGELENKEEQLIRNAGTKSLGSPFKMVGGVLLAVLFLLSI